MAWYAELKRRQWYCINGINAITNYRKARYEAWYSSLSEEQKQHLEERKRLREKQAEEELQKSIERIVYMTSRMFHLASGVRAHDIDKYHGVYDSNGFPKKWINNNKKG